MKSSSDVLFFDTEERGPAEWAERADLCKTELLNKVPSKGTVTTLSLNKLHLDFPLKIVKNVFPFSHSLVRISHPMFPCTYFALYSRSGNKAAYRSEAARQRPSNGLRGRTEPAPQQAAHLHATGRVPGRNTAGTKRVSCGKIRS